MAFWGVEVKSGRPFIHKYDDSKGRLHISMATLGFGSATTRSTLQCNVGNRSPVYLCSLYPGSTESLQLNLELEEVDQVVFTVIGARSIHLCGYYLGRTSRTAIFHGDSSESYGEDIADTENERSDFSDEDDLDDSFIDDDPNPEVFPPSPISNGEEASDDNKPEGKKSKFGRLRKKYYSVESDDDGDGGFEEKIIVNDTMDDQMKESDNEDSLLISSLYKVKARQRISDDEINASDSGAFDARNKNYEDDGDGNIQTDLETDNILQDSQRDREAAVSDKEKDVGDVKKSKKKKKEKQKETKSSPNGQSIKLDKNEKDKPKFDKMTQDILAGKEQNKDGADDDKQTETVDKMLSLSEDSLLISPTFKIKSRRKIFDEENHKTGDDEAFNASNKNDQDGGDSIVQTTFETNNVIQDSQMQREAALSDKKKDVGDVKKSKKKKKEKETKSSPNGHSINLDKSEQDKPKIEVTLDILTGQEQIKDGANDDKQTETVDKNLPSSEAGHVQDEKPKKKRKERQKEHMKQPTVNEDVETVAAVALPEFVEDAGKAKTKRRKKEQTNKGLHLEGERSVEDGAHDFSNGNQNEEKVKKGKSKSKSKSKGNIEA
ncbi:hypothetical protein HN51_064542 [Arachis hypogaea]|uniref:uncharacterized protein n=1 Tax=Arachis hypogaea TaxID=3818 RepID=UPI000DECF213|nr:peptidyl-prolyl cis-trans isomerase FKBP43 isoform X1 [Arachis hypogaea]